MNIDNITSSNMTLDYYGKMEQIKLYENLIQEKDKEIERLNNIINECVEEILKELQENHHLSYGVALAIRQKLINYRELKERCNNK